MTTKTKRQRPHARKIIPRGDQHPTAKPPELAEHFIQLHTKPGDIVLDPFMGEASTAIACLRAGRRFIGIEIDPHWFKASRRRIIAALQAAKSSSRVTQGGGGVPPCPGLRNLRPLA